MECFVDGLVLKAAGVVRVDATDTGWPVSIPLISSSMATSTALGQPPVEGRSASQNRGGLLRHLKPDLRTIVAFRRENRSAFRKVFREFVLLCRLVGRSIYRRYLPSMSDASLSGLGAEQRATI